jgi:hypothetical protein
MEFLDFLFFTILIIYIVRSVLRIVLPMVFQKVVDKAQQQQSAGRHQQNYSSNARAGQVKVDYVPQAKKGSVPDSEGEFVDYEEVK